jgi:redox-sensitive bicupin YhaK (pirin superfamily)
LVASPESAEQAVKLNADAHMYAGLFDGAEESRLVLQSERKAYVFLIRGELHVNQMPLQSGDALMVSDESELHLYQGKNAEVLVFDLAA